MSATGINGWRFPSYSDSPDVPRDLGALAEDISAFIEANPGPQGEQGSAATISIGSITTVDSTTPAAVTNSGTSGSAIFNFTIPRGVDGIIGGRL